MLVAEWLSKFDAEFNNVTHPSRLRKKDKTLNLKWVHKYLWESNSFISEKQTNMVNTNIHSTFIWNNSVLVFLVFYKTSFFIILQQLRMCTVCLFLNYALLGILFGLHQKLNTRFIMRMTHIFFLRIASIINPFGLRTYIFA